MINAFDESGGIPVNDPVPITTYSPVRIAVPGRPAPLDVKISAPAVGQALPVILLSHGHGATMFLSSLHGYAPMADFWAEHGFVVIQPTHLDSTLLGLQQEPLPDAPLFWRDRATDMHVLLDHLPDIEAAVPGLAGRIDRDQVVAFGHSLGGMTVTMLLGMRVLDPDDDRATDLADPRIRAGVVIGAPGLADEHSGEWVTERFPMLQHLDFSTMTGTALVMAGDQDLNPAFSNRLSYRWDAYTHSPAGNKTLAMFTGAGHIFGGISGYDSVEAADLDPRRIAMVRALVWAYFRTQLDPTDAAWPDAITALQQMQPSTVRVETR